MKNVPSCSHMAFFASSVHLPRTEFEIRTRSRRFARNLGGSCTFSDQPNGPLRVGIKTVSLVEFGVASGAGLTNIVEIAKKVTRCTGVEFTIYGFDTGQG